MLCKQPLLVLDKLKICVHTLGFLKQWQITMDPCGPSSKTDMNAIERWVAHLILSTILTDYIHYTRILTLREHRSSMLPSDGNSVRQHLQTRNHTTVKPKQK